MKTATFYMLGNHAITVGNVESVEVIRNTSSGEYTGYKIKWADADKAPDLFSLSIPNIVAVVVEEDK